MKKFIFRVVSKNPDYDHKLNVIEMVESISGDVPYYEMERIVDYFLWIGDIPSGVSEVFGEIEVNSGTPELKIVDLIE
jgi:hypothetical protein